MTVSEQDKLDEAFYDAEVAPLLLKAANLCQSKGISMVCWDSFSRTVTLAEDSPFAARLVDLAAKCQGNVDAMWIALIKDARKNGHGGSSFLYLELKKESDAWPH